MKKIICIIATLFLTLALCACGGGSSSSEAALPAPSHGDSSSTASTAEVTTPPEDEEMEWPAAIEDDAALAEPDTTQDKISGIVYMNRYYSRNSSGMYDSNVEIGVIDPESGATEVIRNFNAANPAYFYSVSQVPWRGHIYESIFSPDYSVMALVKNTDDGCMHAGWVDENGTFVDVTELIAGDVGDFGITTYYDKDPFFDKDYQYFYFRRGQSRDSSSYSDTWKRVPVDNVSPEAVEDLQGNGFVGLDYDGSFISGSEYVKLHGPDGQVLADTRYVRGWLNSTRYLARAEGGGLLYIVDGTSEDADGTLSSRTAIIPDINDRVNDYPVLSPDKTQVAFLSYLKTPNSNSPQLFITSMDGNTDPRKIDTNLTFKIDGNWDNCFIIDWID